MTETKTELRLSDAMIERAAAVIAKEQGHVTGPCDSDRECARVALAAAFDEVPLTNFGIGLALQFFDLVICIKDGAGWTAQAGVYRKNGDPDRFDGLGHRLTVHWGHKPVRYLKSVTVGDLDAPEVTGA